jgi:hypothetical protein
MMRIHSALKQVLSLIVIASENMVAALHLVSVAMHS